MDADADYTYTVIQPSSVEEPVSPDLSELPPSDSDEMVDTPMRSQSWYEPEKDRESIFEQCISQVGAQAHFP